MSKLYSYPCILLLVVLACHSRAYAQDAIAPEELSQKISAAVKKAQDQGKRESLRGLEFRVRADGILSIAPMEAFTLEESDGFIIVKITNPDALFVVEQDTGIVRARRVDVYIQQSTSAQVDILELNPQSPCVSVLQIYQVGQKRPLNISALEKSPQYEVMWTYPEDKIVLEEVVDENAVVRRVADGPAVVVMTLVDHKANRRQNVEFPIRDCMDPEPVAPPPPVIEPEPKPESTVRLSVAIGAGTEVRATVGFSRVAKRYLSSISLFAGKPLVDIEFDGTTDLKPWSIGVMIGTGVVLDKFTLAAQMPIGIVWQTPNPVVRLGAEGSLGYEFRPGWAVQAVAGLSAYNTSDQLPFVGVVNIIGAWTL